MPSSSYSKKNTNLAIPIQTFIFMNFYKKILVTFNILIIKYKFYTNTSVSTQKVTVTTFSIVTFNWQLTIKTMSESL